jgi:hypothetical protein
MRHGRSILLGAVACLVAPNMASSTTSGELLQSCREITSGIGPNTGAEVDIPPTGLTCWYYMSAIQNMSVLETSSGSHQGHVQRLRAAGITVDEEEINIAHLKLIVQLAEQSRLPAIYPFKMFVQAGGLMSYGIDIPAMGHGIADIVGQILKGAKPSDIPIRQPTKFELVINLKTAKALGLTIPPLLLTTADEVIE